MPFKNAAQRRACYAKNDPNWNCKEWDKHTKSKFCGAKCQDGHKCERLCHDKKCWQHS